MLEALGGLDAGPPNQLDLHHVINSPALTRTTVGNLDKLKASLINSDKPGERKPFYPCSHDGDCATAQCSCFEGKIHCEKTCACSKGCERQFPGCKCLQSAKACRQTAKCDCYRLGRECDPDLCIHCGAIEVLDPENRHHADLTHGRCSNVGIQHGVPKRLILGRSPVQGFGLFVGEPIIQGDFLGEYNGEVLSTTEWERRGEMYGRGKRQYTFTLNTEQEIDGVYSANKIRYVNHSKNPQSINCAPEMKLCNTTSRIGLFATRNLVPGEELLFNYGYREDDTKGFIELVPMGAVKAVKQKKAAPTGKKATKGLLRAHDGLPNLLINDNASDYTEPTSQFEEEDDGDEVEEEARLASIAAQERSDDEDYNDARPSDYSSPKRRGRRRKQDQDGPSAFGANSRKGLSRQASSPHVRLGLSKLIPAQRSSSSAAAQPEGTERRKRKRAI